MPTPPSLSPAVASCPSAATTLSRLQACNAVLLFCCRNIYSLIVIFIQAWTYRTPPELAALHQQIQLDNGPQFQAPTTTRRSRITASCQRALMRGIVQLNPFLSRSVYVPAFQPQLFAAIAPEPTNADKHQPDNSQANTSSPQTNAPRTTANTGSTPPTISRAASAAFTTPNSNSTSSNIFASTLHPPSAQATGQLRSTPASAAAAAAQFNTQRSMSPYLSPRSPPPPPKRHSLVLDLDETLVHTTTVQPRRYNYQLDLSTQLTRNKSAVRTFYISQRPYLELFLTQLCSHYQLIIFTASVSRYADAIIDIIDSSILRPTVEHQQQQQHLNARNSLDSIKSLLGLAPSSALQDLSVSRSPRANTAPIIDRRYFRSHCLKNEFGQFIKNLYNITTPQHKSKSKISSASNTSVNQRFAASPAVSPSHSGTNSHAALQQPLHQHAPSIKRTILVDNSPAAYSLNLHSALYVPSLHSLNTLFPITLSRVGEDLKPGPPSVTRTPQTAKQSLTSTDDLLLCTCPAFVDLRVNRPISSWYSEPKAETEQQIAQAIEMLNEQKANENMNQASANSADDCELGELITLLLGLTLFDDVRPLLKRRVMR